ncbi:hypothetical protein V8C44DRAFT_16426 [Trichoderma aethiopicum]
MLPGSGPSKRGVAVDARSKLEPLATDSEARNPSSVDFVHSPLDWPTATPQAQRLVDFVRAQTQWELQASMRVKHVKPPVLPVLWASLMSAKVGGILGLVMGHRWVPDTGNARSTDQGDHHPRPLALLSFRFLKEGIVDGKGGVLATAVVKAGTPDLGHARTGIGAVVTWRALRPRRIGFNEDTKVQRHSVHRGQRTGTRDE